MAIKSLVFQMRTHLFYCKLFSRYFFLKIWTNSFTVIKTFILKIIVLDIGFTNIYIGKT